MAEHDGWDLQHLVPWLVYAALYLCIVYLGIQDDIVERYPPAFITVDVACCVLNWLAIVIFAFRVQSNRLRWWARLLFPVVVLDLAAGIVMDAFMPHGDDPTLQGLTWVVSTLLALVCVSPAYYAGFRLSYSQKKLPGAA